MDELNKVLSNINAATALQWMITIVGLTTSLSICITKLITKGQVFFEKWRKKKNNKEAQEDLIERSEEQIEQLMQSIEKLSEQISVLREESIQRDKIQIRHTIVTCCNEAIDNRGIDSSELQALEDLYTLYTVDPINGNSYATTLMMKVRKLPIVPKGTLSHES